MVIRRLELEQPREEAEDIAVSPLASRAKSGAKSREVVLSETGTLPGFHSRCKSSLSRIGYEPRLTIHRELPCIQRAKSRLETSASAGTSRWS
jgi:hypothetical protein